MLLIILSVTIETVEDVYHRRPVTFVGPLMFSLRELVCGLGEGSKCGGPDYSRRVAIRGEPLLRRAQLSPLWSNGSTLYLAQYGEERSF